VGRRRKSAAPSERRLARNRFVQSMHAGVQLVTCALARPGEAHILLLVTTSGLGATNHDTRDAAHRSGVPTEHFPLTRRDISFIVGFWLIYALLTIANHAFDPGPPDRRPDGTLTTWVFIELAEAALWALLTPLIVSLAGRARSEHMSRGLHFLLLALVGVLIALGVSVVGHELRDLLMQRPPRADGSDRGRGPPLWYGFLNALVIYLGVLAAGLARAYSLRLGARREQATQLQAQLAEARLEALRSQLDPHFLFNTLNAVSSLVERDPRGVRRMITRLSELLRFSMEDAREPEITLRRELDLLDRYLDIMQVRFPGLNVLRLLDDHALDVMVPSMILQPLVENAIRHGVEKMTEPGRIEIEALLEGETLVMRVTDNGPGIAESSPGPSDGVGLRNTRARLEQLYGADGRFSLARVNELTVAEVRLPATRDRAELRVEGTESTSDDRR
jgi:two-component system, LytTR family, sensor kinase